MRLLSSETGLVGNLAFAPETLSEKLDRFDTMLRASDSATATLALWIGIPTGQGHRGLHARLRPGPDVVPPADVLDRLEVPGPQDIAYRRVWLIYRGRILSDAENWFVPARLTGAMRMMLAEDEIPFGAVVSPLLPTRETLSAERLWRPGGARPREGLPARMLRHRALMRTSSGEPICEVSEIYTRNILT